MSTLDILLIAGGGLLAVCAIVAAFFAWRGEGSLIAMSDTPTSSIVELASLHAARRFGARVEVVGTIECDTPLQAPYSEKLCVAYDYVVTEENERTIGPRGWRGGYEIEHNSVDLHDRRVPRFYVRDATGRIAVDTTGAAIDMLETVARYANYTGDRGMEREIWREERALLLGHRVYVLGFLGDEHGAPILGRHPLEPAQRFLISHRDERTFAAAVRRRAYGLYLAGGLGLGGAAALIVAALLF